MKEKSPVLLYAFLDNFLIIYTVCASSASAGIWNRVEVRLGQSGDMRDTPNIRDIVGPVIPDPLAPYWMIIIICLALLVALSVISVRRWKRTETRHQPFTAKLAFKAVVDFERTYVTGKCKTLEYYSQLSDIFRKYLAYRFDIKASAMTAEEIVHSIREMQVLEEEVVTKIGEVLCFTDVVRFAGQEPLRDEALSYITDVKTIIQDTGGQKL
jgi:hypothetical protein